MTHLNTYINKVFKKEYGWIIQLNRKGVFDQVVDNYICFRAYMLLFINPRTIMQNLSAR